MPKWHILLGCVSFTSGPTFLWSHMSNSMLYVFCVFKGPNQRASPHHQNQNLFRSTVSDHNSYNQRFYSQKPPCLQMMVSNLYLSWSLNLEDTQLSLWTHWNERFRVTLIPSLLKTPFRVTLIPSFPVRDVVVLLLNPAGLAVQAGFSSTTTNIFFFYRKKSLLLFTLVSILQ